jgi:hypothetical protein
VTATPKYYPKYCWEKSSYSAREVLSWLLYMVRVFWLALELLTMVLTEDCSRKADCVIA